MREVHGTSGTVHRVSTKITFNFRKCITPALHCGRRFSLRTSNIPNNDIPDNDKANIRERTQNTRQSQNTKARTAGTGLNAAAASISRITIFL
jgi:hypothetical protein